MKIVSWNVNGLDACLRKGFLNFLSRHSPDVICCQETKVDQNYKFMMPEYTHIWNRGKYPGYSGTLVLVKQLPLSYTLGLGIDKLDDEGRVITVEYPDYFILNVYVPSIHTYSEPTRPEYRNEWEQALRKYISTLNKPIILCGDMNAIAAPIDTYPHKEEQKEDIFLPEKQSGLEKLLATGLVDAFRAKYPHKQHAYTWWGPKHPDRADKPGTRLDYFLVSE